MCVEGMIWLFSSSINIAGLNGVCPEQMAKAGGLVGALNVHLSTLGGAAGVLERRRRSWDTTSDVGDTTYDVGDTTYEVGEWDLLVSRFKGIEGGGGHSVEITTP